MIQLNLNGSDIPETLGITKERADEMAAQFGATTEQWNDSEEEQTTVYLLGRMNAIAKTHEEQLYVVYQFGRFIGSNYAPNIEAAIMRILS